MCIRKTRITTQIKFKRKIPKLILNLAPKKFLGRQNSVKSVAINFKLRLTKLTKRVLQEFRNIFHATSCLNRLNNRLQRFINSYHQLLINTTTKDKKRKLPTIALLTYKIRDSRATRHLPFTRRLSRHRFLTKQLPFDSPSQLTKAAPHSYITVNDLKVLEIFTNSSQLSAYPRLVSSTFSASTHFKRNHLMVLIRRQSKIQLVRQQLLQFRVPSIHVIHMHQQVTSQTAKHKTTLLIFQVSSITLFHTQEILLLEGNIQSLQNVLKL